MEEFKSRKNINPKKKNVPYYEGRGEKIERNQAIASDYVAGMSTAELVKKYGISQTRIYQLINRYEVWGGGKND